MSDSKIIVWSEQGNLDVANLESSGFNYLILSFIHVGHDALPYKMGLATDSSGTGYYLVFNGTGLFNTYDYSSYVSELNNGTFPKGLREASAGSLPTPLSNDLNIVTLTDSESWGMYDNNNDFLYKINIHTDSHGVEQMTIWDPQWVEETQMNSVWTQVSTLQGKGFKVLASMGGWDNDGDWNSIIAHTTTVADLFIDLILNHKLQGFDLDNEGVYTDACTTAVAQFVKLVTGSTRFVNAPICTAAPFSSSYSWFTGLLTHTTFTDTAGIFRNYFDWFHLQLYTGTSNDAPSYYQTYYDEFPSPSTSVGIDDTATFLVPGFTNDSGELGSAAMQSNLAAIVNGDSKNDIPPYAINGGFVWRLNFITPNESDWGTAISQGVQGVVAPNPVQS